MHRSIISRVLILTLLLSGSVFAQNNTAQNNAGQQATAQNGAQYGPPTQRQVRSSRQLTPEEYAKLQAQYQPKLPPGFPLPADHQDYLGKVLDYWAQTSAKVNQSTAAFRSWEYDPEFCNFRDPKTNKLAAHKILDGQIRFSSPDKGQYEVTKMWVFETKKDANGQVVPDYNPVQTKMSHEKWICDGKSIFEYDFENSIIYETEIPLEMRGKQIVNSPLPFFLFGADKQTMLDRYWLRTVTPRSAENEIWLEAYPKTLADARNYKKLEIILSTEDWLPKSLHLYAPNYDIVKNPQSRAYEFENRQINGQLVGIQDFFRVFVRPKKPLGWKWVKRDSVPETASNPASQLGPVRK